MKTKRRVRLFALAILLIPATQSLARADTFNFTLKGVTDTANCVLTTDSVSYSPECSVGSGGCYAIKSMTGQFDGQNITTLVPLGDYWGLLSASLNLLPVGSGVGFSVGTQIWGLTSNTPNQAAVLFGIAAYYPDHTYSTSNDSEFFTLTITSTPESGTSSLLAFGLLVLLALNPLT
jgi:hypothetical protein